MNSLLLQAETATRATLAPFGQFIGADRDSPVFAEWAGVTVLGPAPVKYGLDVEILHVRMQAAAFPARVQLLERHPKHTQTYLSANGRPFVMVLGARTLADGLPDASALRAFMFRDGDGVAMAASVWHEFPLALEDDTRFTVILSRESHINLLAAPEHALDARGPDLDRYDMLARQEILVCL
jgi:ureidoglycolate lyase